jgi:hypothetical protein
VQRLQGLRLNRVLLLGSLAIQMHVVALVLQLGELKLLLLRLLAGLIEIMAHSTTLLLHPLEFLLGLCG